MPVMPDRWIRKMALEHRMIEPFEDRQVRDGVISYGLSSYGYDARIGMEYRLFSNIDSPIVDPKNFDERSHVVKCERRLIIPPNSYALAASLEYFRIPSNVLVICIGKSTYARCGVIVNTTPLEPGWEGNVTLEISNATPSPVVIYGGEGIAQFIFLEGKGPPEITYATKGGKYQGQRGVTGPIVERNPT